MDFKMGSKKLEAISPTSLPSKKQKNKMVFVLLHCAVDNISLSRHTHSHSDLFSLQSHIIQPTAA